MKYRHLFFDLDHTLWDFERNSSESLEEIFHTLTLIQYGVSSLDSFIQSFLKINTALWDAFDRGTVHHTYIRENRFKMVFEELGANLPPNHTEIGEAYLRTLPDKKHLLEGALDLLNYANSAGYSMHIITNGFNEIQARKIASSEIGHFFENIITFDTANAKKPDPKIFAYALETARAVPSESIMIGDNWVADIMGAKQFGMDTVYYNPAGLQFDESPTYDIRRLEELMLIL
ncbi:MULTISPECIES: YjjG family noncanonical pyrimidine nucleotidase [Dyadobacter]|jgi:YjjG family noncanonical pyrimidine nucleotidase|uniref:YjjG family noncanonical pyrimidine nucleotidase n=1 Tax=Dyadobacter chenhuakuii TaxID=2909339 RepID=A0A9X1QFC7_9BACT|nr:MULTISPECIES: YjjG family noncanonical pyrimidine nucleotidase [Dyadobacter]MCE7073443.1 YjjG family noncanonical pyrimidine nucleotidase [Dyadobacter sp. CY327]MCF2499452.1 YjjG family noncanonical pyrimidine nucleotidase [Dyadobacter chenhuakuii]